MVSRVPTLWFVCGGGGDKMDCCRTHTPSIYPSIHLSIQAVETQLRPGRISDVPYGEVGFWQGQPSAYFTASHRKFRACTSYG